MFDVRAAGVVVPAGQCREDLLQGNIVGLEFRRIDQNLVLLGQAAKRIHVHHPRHRAEFFFHNPILQRSNFLGGKPRGRAQSVPVNFSNRCAVGGQPRLRAGWQGYGPQKLARQVANCGIDRVVLKYQRHLRQSEHGDGAHRNPLGYPVHGALDRNGNQPLHLLSRVARKRCDDLHRNIRHVRVSLHRQMNVGIDPQGDKDAQGDDDNRPVMQHQRSQLADHELSPSSSACSNNAPSVTTRSPAATPSNTGTFPSCSVPTVTRRRWYLPRATSKNRNEFSPFMKIAFAGISTPACPSSAAWRTTSTVTYISARSTFSGLSTMPRTLSVRVLGSMVAPIFPTFP